MSYYKYWVTLSLPEIKVQYQISWTIESSEKSKSSVAKKQTQIKKIKKSKDLLGHSKWYDIIIKESCIYGNKYVQ